MRRLRLWVVGSFVLALVLSVVHAEVPAPQRGPSAALQWSDLRDAARRMIGLPAARPRPRPQPVALLDLPRREMAPVGEPAAEPRRVRELVERRSANATFFQLTDGRVQAEVSSTPVHYRDAAGQWAPIDTRVVATDRDGYAFANDTNTFGSAFGPTSDRLVTFDLRGRAVTIGAAGQPRPVAPVASGDTVRFPDVFGPGVDVAYRVAGDELKGAIVLAGRPPAGGPVQFTLTLDVRGLTVRGRPDGSIGFYEPDVQREPLLVMPAPFMYDSGVDPTSPYGAAASSAVTQTVYGEGDRLHVVVSADAGWLADPARVYPVVIDPTIKIQPTPTQSQDAMIVSDGPNANYDGSWRLSVGTTDRAKARSLVKFDLTTVPPGTRLDSASLQLYYDQDHTTGSFDVPLEARRVTAPWTESTVTWRSINEAMGEVGGNVEVVDDADEGSTAFLGEWPPATDAAATGGGYRVNDNASTGDTFTWVPRLTESGDYTVEAHFVAGGDRAPAAPYTVHHQGGTAARTVDQSAGSGGVWAPLGTYPFVAGTSHQVVLGDVAGEAVVADALRFTKPATVVKRADESSVWHSYSVRSIVQGWLDGVNPNHGFMLKAVDEAAAGRGGPRYEAAEFAYNGENENTPKLLLTYGKPGVELAAPTKIYSTGAELNWSSYAGSDIVEYQVHRSIFQTFTPTAATLIAPVDPSRTAFTDTTATPTAVDDPDPFGQVYYYMVAVKTSDGSLIPAPTQIVRLPRAGRIVQLFQGDQPDTTLSSNEPNAGHDVLAANPWVMVGNNSGTYGTTRVVVGFPNLDLPPGARILDAEFGLWSVTTIGSGATYNVHALTRSFDETAGSWAKADAATAWTTAGGDYDPTVADIVVGNTNDPAWRFWYVPGIVQGWVDDPADNHGLLVKLANETTPAERTIFLSGEAPEPQLRPKMVVVYTEPTPVSTYHAPDTPATRMIPGDQYTVPVTINNPTTSTWAASEWELSYRWNLPDGTDVTNGGNQLATPLPSDVAPGQAATLNAALKTPIQSGTGNKRHEYVLRWELRKKATGEWLSTTDGIGPLDQNVIVDEPRSDQLGQEQFHQYSGPPTGSGSSAAVNLASGNAIWSYRSFSNPSLGGGTFVRMTYNSLDTASPAMGFGWSISATTLHRLGSPLHMHPPGQSWPTQVTLVDGDGTTHTFTLNKHGSADEALWDYDHPAGVHLYLQKNLAGDETRAWMMTRPNRSRIYFDTEGYQTAFADNNGNELLFTYEERKSNNKPTKFLRYITDPAGRRTAEITYYAKGDSYTYLDDNWVETNATNLTNPHIIDQIRSIVDVAGRRIDLFYTDKGLMAKMVDGAGSTQPKVFRFTYDMTQGNRNVKLMSVTDPRDHVSRMSYYDPPGDDPQFHWWAKTLTDRLGGVTSVAYLDPDGPQGSTLTTTVTDAELHTAVFQLDGFGRRTEMTDALNQVTKTGWDADNNVIRVEEPNGAVTTATYDQLTGLPLTRTDAEANRNGTAPDRLTYQTGLRGHIADLMTQTSPLDHSYAFTYDTVGNLKTITDPVGTATSTSGDHTTTFDYDTVGRMVASTDANGHTATYGDFDPTGQPKRVTDVLGNTTTMTYDGRGNVLTITDARGKTSSVNFDLYGRALDTRVPRDAAVDEYIVTPAPSYDANDNVTQWFAANGAVSTAAYDDADQIISQNAPKDTPGGPERRTTYTYDRMGNLRSMTEPRGYLTTDPDDFVTRYGYDVIYQRTSMIDTDGGVTSYTYDSAGNITRIVDPKRSASADPDDYSVLYAYDLNHRAVGATDPVGNTSSATYDLDGRITSMTDETGATTQLAYDQRGLLVQEKVPHDTVDGVTNYNVTEYSYDQVGNRVKVTSPRGVATTDDPDDFADVTVYDELNRVKEQVTRYDRDDPVYDVGEKIIYTYDEVGNLTKVSLPPSGRAPGVPGTRVDTTYSYTDDGLIASSVDAFAITTTYGHDALGQQTSRTVTGADGGLSRTMRWTYYPDGKLKHREDDGVPKGSNVVLGDNSDVGFTFTDGPVPWTTTSAGAGFLGTDYATHAPGTGENSISWQATAISPGGDYEIFVRYPAVDGAATNATFRVRAAGGVDQLVTVDQTQRAGEWVSLGVFPYNEGTVPYSITLTDNANGIVVADAVKRVRVFDPAADDEFQSFDYTYDVNGNLVELADGSSGATITGYTMGYNELNQIMSMVEQRGGTSAHTATYEYDLAGNLTRRTYDERIDEFEYDARDLVSKVTHKQFAGDPEPMETTYGYTPRAQLAFYTKELDNRIEFEYYQDGLLKHQKETQGFFNRTVAEHTLRYDANGNTAEDVSRVMDAENPDLTLDRRLTYEYDPRDRVVEVLKTGGVETYSYDANSNILSQIFDEGLNKRTHVHNTYDRNRLTHTTTLKFDGMGGETGDSTSYYYDPLGRLIYAPSSDTQVWYHYDGFDRKTKHEVTAALGAVQFVTDYLYDPLDRVTHTTRLVRTPETGERTVNTDFQYIGASDLLLDENRDNGRVHSFYSYGLNGDRLWSDTTSTDGSPAAQYFYSYNPHGDVEAVTIPSGTTDATYGYTAYGADDVAMFTGVDKPDPNNPNKEPVNTFRYSARQWDQASGTYDMGFRDYSPLLSRFLTPDAYRGALADRSLSANPATANRYGFTGGNPVNSIEIDGHYSWGEFFEDVVNVTAGIAVFSACAAILGVTTLGVGFIFCSGLSTAVWAGLEYASNPQEGGHTAGGMAGAAGLGFLEGVVFAPVGFALGKGLAWLGGKAFRGLHQLIRAEGSQAMAEGLQVRAAQLQAMRGFAGGTTAVVRVQNKWFPFLKRNWVAVENDRAMPAEWAGVFGRAERFIRGPGHAEQTIVDNLGRNWWIVAGGTNRNVCLAMATGQCAVALEALGITIGGRTWPWKEEAFGKYLGIKTDFRTFWYQHR
ncbi:MAG TPA: DNRLRE domain-containing protein [Jiangellales bacterium]|nr:DNRLRE domain-containing protein [Jiangellales bacterium]